MASIINAATSGGLITTADTSGILNIQTASTTAVTIDGSQNVGIGTTSPAQTLHVKTSTSATPITLGVLSNATGLPAISFNGAYASTTMAGIYGNGATASSLYYEVPSGNSHFWGIADSTKMTLDASGKLGIGNTVPNAPLDVRGDTGSTVSAVMRIRGTNTTVRTTRLQFEDYAGTIADATIDFKIPTAGSAASAILQMGINGAAALAIDVNSNVGIGTTSPLAKLHIGAETEVNLTNQALFVQGAKSGYAGYAGLVQGQMVIYDQTAGTAGSGGAIGFGANTGSSQRTWIASINSERDSSTNDGSNYGGSLVFYTRPPTTPPLERVRIDSSGNFFINKTSVAVGNGLSYLPNVYGAGIGLLDLRGNSAGADVTIMQAYRTSNSTYAFFVQWNGQIYASQTSILSASDRSLKQNIRSLETGLSEIMALQPRRFDWIDGRAQNVAGFVAQEVQPYLPDLIESAKYSENEDGTTEYKLSIRMSDMIPTMVKAIQEQQALITQLQADVAALKGA